MIISVYITSFNKEIYLSQAIDSVLTQALTPKEIIIVDDGSSDNSRDIINGFASRYPDIIVPVFNSINMGISKSRNIAISRCTGDIITFVDGDDFYFPSKLESELKIITGGNYGCVYSNHVFVNEYGVEKGVFADEEELPPIGDIFIENYSRFFNVSTGSNFHNEMFYKSCAEDIGFYDENIKLWEDWDFRIRMSKKYQYGYCPEVNSAYRKLGNSLHNADPEFHYREQIKIYNKNKPLAQDLEEGEKLLIKNRIYSKIKRLFIQIVKKDRQNNKIFHAIYYGIYFMVTFRTRKSISTAFRTWMES